MLFAAQQDAGRHLSPQQAQADQYNQRIKADNFDKRGRCYHGFCRRTRSAAADPDNGSSQWSLAVSPMQTEHDASARQVSSFATR
jgi:hypothetical protein